MPNETKESWPKFQKIKKNNNKKKKKEKNKPSNFLGKTK